MRADRPPGPAEVLRLVDSGAMTDFADRARTFIDELFELEPTFATAMGEHRHDNRWPDRSAENVLAPEPVPAPVAAAARSEP